jgi:hypothetical protein
VSANSQDGHVALALKFFNGLVNERRFMTSYQTTYRYNFVADSQAIEHFTSERSRGKSRRRERRNAECASDIQPLLELIRESRIEGAHDDRDAGGDASRAYRRPKICNLVIIERKKTFGVLEPDRLKHARGAFIGRRLHRYAGWENPSD